MTATLTESIAMTPISQLNENITNVLVSGVASNDLDIQTGDIAIVNSARNSFTGPRANQVDEPAPTLDGQVDQYLSGFRLVIFTISLMLVTFIIALDTTIIATAVPRMTTSFHTIHDIGWYNSAYLLPLTALQPTFGKIYSFFNIKYVFIASILMFEAGSAICATSPSSAIFILGRIVAGIGAASIFAGGMTIMGFAIPLNRIAIFMATLSSMYGVAGLAGPVLGGLITETPQLTWRFCFWVNLPFGGICIAFFLFGFTAPIRQPSELTWKQKFGSLDLAGAVLFISSICCLFVGLQWGGIEYPWSDSRVWGLMLGFGLLMAAFVLLQKRLGESATIPLRMFRIRSLTFSVAVAICMSIGVNTHTSYLPFFFQSAKGDTSGRSGILMLPYLLSVTATELAVGTAVTALGLYVPFMIFGTAIFTTAASLLCTITTQSGTARIIGYQILAAAGFGSSLCLCATAVRASVRDKDLPIANALTVFGPFFGGALASSIAQNIFRRELSGRILLVVGGNETAVILAAGATGGVGLVDGSLRPAVLEAFGRAVDRTFVLPAVVGGVAFLCTFGIKWRDIRKGGKEE